MAHYENSFTWRVEMTRTEEGKHYRLNRSVTVICPRIDQAIAEVYKKWPDAEIIKAFRGERWGNDGVIVLDEAAS